MTPRYAGPDRRSSRPKHGNAVVWIGASVSLLSLLSAVVYIGKYQAKIDLADQTARDADHAAESALARLDKLEERVNANRESLDRLRDWMKAVSERLRTAPPN